MSGKFDPVPVTLQGKAVRLEPLVLRHAEDLFAAGREEEIWRFMPQPVFQEADDTRNWIAEALQSATDGSQIPFVIVDLVSSKAIGSTRYLEIQRDNSSLEIGWTWIAKPISGRA